MQEKMPNKPQVNITKYSETMIRLLPEFGGHVKHSKPSFLCNMFIKNSKRSVFT